MGFQGSRIGQQLLLRDSLRRQNVRHDGFSLCDRPGLVKGDDLHIAGLLQRFRGLIENAVFRSHAAADHDGDRGRETQSAGAADDQDRNAAREGKADGAVQDKQPEKGHDQGDRDDCRNKDARDRIRQLCDRGLGGGRVAHHLDDLGQSAVLADPGRLAAQKAGLVQGCRGNFIAGVLVHRNALSGQGGLIDRAAALHDNAVHRDIFTGTDDEDIALSDIVDTDFLLLTVSDDGGGLGRQLHQTLEGVRRFPLGPRFQHLAYRDQGQDHGRRLKVKFHHVLRDRGGISVRLCPCHGKEHGCAVHEGCPGSQRDQGVHIGSPVEEALKSADKKLLVDHHDNACQKQLQQAHGNMIPMEKGRKRKSQHHMAHGKIHENQEEAQGSQKSPLQDWRLAVLERVLLRGQLCGKAAGRAGSAACPGVYALGSRPVAGIFNRLHDRFRRSSPFHRKCIGQKTDITACHAVHLRDGFFNTSLTSGTAHACNCVLIHFKPLFLSLPGSEPFFKPHTCGHCSAFTDMFVNA